ncbi:MAG: hypothetical protein M3Z54_11375 [Gemmatimonadota bacterium]|nr:hypothetical protein [Gemmatimonadota bacterium]
MKAALISFVGLPLVLIALITIQFGFRTLYTLAASAIGEVLGLFLYAWYTKWKVAAILSGKASGAVTYVGTDAPRGLVEASLKLIGFGIGIGLLVLLGHWAYARMRSA